MSDVHSPTTRSYNMSMIKGKDTKPEVAVRKYLFSQGFRYRKNVRKMPGSPDIVLPKYKTCIFVNGCFWHKHEGCRYFVWPKSNEEFWRNKIETNVARDNRNYNTLKANGWNVIVIWECEIKGDFEETMKKVLSITYTKEGKQYCPKCKAIRDEMLKGAFVECYQILCRQNRDLVDNAIDETFDMLSNENIENGLSELRKKLSHQKLRKERLLDRALLNSVSDETFDKKQHLLMLKSIT